MSSIEDDVLNIRNIPHDIIRTIILFGQEDIDDMKLISPVWNVLVQEHISNRKHLHMINYLRWTRNGYGKIVLKIRVLKRFLKYFNVGHWQERPLSASEYEDEVEVESDTLTTSSESSIRTINRIFERCSRIEIIDLKLDFIDDESEILKNAIIGLNIDKLVFKSTLDLKHSKIGILDLIEHSHVKSLVFIENKLCTYDFDAIHSAFTHFLPCITAIELISCDPDDDEYSLQERLQIAHFLQIPVRRRRNFNQNLQQHADDENRFIWREFKNFLNSTDNLAATFNEATLSDERVQFRIDIAAKLQ